jgi:hypothetical protein
MTPVLERVKTVHALDCMATVIGLDTVLATGKASFTANMLSMVPESFKSSLYRRIIMRMHGDKRNYSLTRT